MRGKRNFEPRNYPAGTVMAREGDPGREAFVIRSGRVAVVLRNGGTTNTVMRSEGEVVGEMALVDQSPRCATLLAEGDVETDVVSFSDFHAMLNSCHPKVRTAVQSLCTLLRDANRGGPRHQRQAALKDLRAKIIDQPEFSLTLESCHLIVRAVVASLLERLTK